MYDDVKDPLRDNYYALLIAIIANKTVSQSLQLMGLSGEMSMTMKKIESKHKTKKEIGEKK